MDRHEVVSLPPGLREPPCQKLVKRLQCLQPPVLTIAICLWRKARVIRAENGEIRRRLDLAMAELTFRNSDKANFEVATVELEYNLFSEANLESRKTSPTDLWRAVRLVQGNLREHQTGLGHLRALLEIAKSDWDSYGYITELIREKIFWAFCFTDYYFALVCLNSGSPESMARHPTSDSVVKTHRELKPPDVRALIEDRLERNRIFMQYSYDRDVLAKDAESRSFSLPPADATDKLLRYEAHLDRQLYRAMDQLERLQGLRKGENVPPPLNVNLGRRT